MVDWLSSMQQTFEYYEVDPHTWKDKQQLHNVISSTINRDNEAGTLGSATIDVTESVGECYIRIYLVTIQNRVRERHPLGTYLVQTPSSSFNGMIRDVSMDAYTPLLELKEKQPPIGYAILKHENIMNIACRLVQEYVRAPVVPTKSSYILTADFVSDPDDTWLTFLVDLLANAKYSFALDEMGRVLFSPEQDIASLQPVWEYTDDNSSILHPDISMEHDLYGIPNVVEVVYSSGVDHYHARVVNDDPNSPISTVNRGREIIHRVVDPETAGKANESEIQLYAKTLLRTLSSIEYTISYTHGYCPVRVGDCVLINYKRAGMTNIKAKVISQSIKCEPGCPVTEKAVFTANLWR